MESLSEFRLGALHPFLFYPFHARLESTNFTKPTLCIYLALIYFVNQKSAVTLFVIELLRIYHKDWSL
jgi:hypothetical protein